MELKRLQVGPLESEILALVWQKQPVTAREIHETLLDDPDRELAYPSVATVLRRLEAKGWLRCDRSGKAFLWHSQISEEQARVLRAQSSLQQFLALSTPEVVAACVEALPPEDRVKLDALAARLAKIRQARTEGE